MVGGGPKSRLKFCDSLCSYSDWNVRRVAFLYLFGEVVPKKRIGMGGPMGNDSTAGVM